MRKKILSFLITLAMVIAIPSYYDISYSDVVYADGEQGWNYNIEYFVRGLYTGCLDREADDTGLNYWYGRIISGEVTGKQAAYGFFFSPEFLNKTSMMTEEQVVNRFYNVFLGRNADETGLSHWKQILKSGGSVDELFEGFADSQEFIGRCEAAGINAGEHIDAPDFISYWGPYSTGFNLIRLNRGQSIDDAAVIGSIVDQCTYWTNLEYSGSPDALHYTFGGKSLMFGHGIDCSGFVTAIYKRAFGTQTFDYADHYNAGIYTSSLAYQGPWGAGETSAPPAAEGVYYTNGDSGRPIYVDRYGIATGYAMNTFQWHYYLDSLGFTGNSYLTWRVNAYSQDQLTEVLNSREFKPGDIVLWYTSAVDAPHTSHIGIYAGNGYVWHCTSMQTNGAQYTPISFMGSYRGTSIQYCRIYHMS